MLHGCKILRNASLGMKLHWLELASFPGPAQFSITCSTEKQLRANNLSLEGKEKVERTYMSVGGLSMCPLK